MKKILFLTIILCVFFAAGTNAALFEDTATHWAKNDIDALVRMGVINGMDENTFAPDGEVTKEQFLKMLMIAKQPGVDDRFLMGHPPVVNPTLEVSPFSDVEITRWSYFYIKEAYGTIIPYNNAITEFLPTVAITREEAAVWMARALSLDPQMPDFLDNEQISDKNLIGAAAANGLINGFEDKTFRPKEHLTRAQAASMLKRLSDLATKLETERMGELSLTHSMDNADLDFDGTNENISVYLDSLGERYIIDINEKRIIGGARDGTQAHYYIVDIDTKDTYLELLVIEQGYSDTAAAIYRYTGDELYALGYIENFGPMVLSTDSIGEEWGAISINGDGTINANIGVQYVHTMLVRKFYQVDSKQRLTDKTGSLYYTVGSYSDFVTNVAIESAKEDENHPAISLQPGYAGRIVSTDLKNWIYIETGSGDSGWLYVGDDRLIKGEFLSHYVDGLWYAG